MSKGRAKGTGYIFKDSKSGIYQLEYKVNGHRKKTSLGVRRLHDRTREDGTIEKGANTLAAELLEAGRQMRTRQEVILDFAEHRGIIEAGNLKLAEVFPKFSKIYRADRRVSDRTFLNYARQWGRFEKWLGDNHPEVAGLREVTEEIAKEYWRLFQDGAASTANQHLSTLKVVFETMKKPAGLLFNPWESIARRVKDGISREYLTKQDMTKLFQSFGPGGTNEHCPAEYRMLLQIGKSTGLRLADCCLLKWSKIDFGKNQIVLIPRKTHRITRQVTIPLFEDFRRALQEWPRETEHVLPKIAAGFTLHESGIKKEIAAIFQRAGFETTVLLPGRKIPTCVIGFHCFRGTLTTDLFNAGVPSSVISTIIGDDIATLEKHYTKVNAAHIHAAIAKLQL